ncbi:hypothetical protein T492DRAFT_838819 [Pavlovales sp. CCMP2436]|nr:hypothetical protein T492DRAFT_838819 [Pavlovales sp. CCMP2436]
MQRLPLTLHVCLYFQVALLLIGPRLRGICMHGVVAKAAWRGHRTLLEWLLLPHSNNDPSNKPEKGLKTGFKTLTHQPTRKCSKGPWRECLPQLLVRDQELLVRDQERINNNYWRECLPQLLARDQELCTQPFTRVLLWSYNKYFTFF